MPIRPRPRPDALTRQEVADALGISYERAYYWTGRGGPSRRTRPLVPPSYGTGRRGGDPDWFSPADVDRLRQVLEVVDAWRALRRPDGGGS